MGGRWVSPEAAPGTTSAPVSDCVTSPSHESKRHHLLCVRKKFQFSSVSDVALTHHPRALFASHQLSVRSGMLDASLVFSVFLVACSSIAKAGLIIAAGALLVRRGALTPEVRKGVSKMAAGLLVPCLLFDRVSSHVTIDLIAKAWPILPLGVIYVALGCTLGTLASRLAPLPPHHQRCAIAATAFANSQAMPIILIDVIGPELFGPTGAQVGTTYIGLYLVVYLVLQWTIGASLLDVPMMTIGGGDKAPARAVPAATSKRARVSSHEGDGMAMLASSSEGGETASRSYVDGDEHSSGEPKAARDDGISASGGGACLLGARALARRVMSPPICAIGVGLMVGLTPPLRWLCVSEDTDAGRHRRAPLAFAMQAARVLGDAAIPVNTMLLGASLAKGVVWRAVPYRTTAAVVLSKLLVMPAVALLLVGALRAAVPSLPPILQLVMVVEASTPTANNLMMMTELAGGAASQMMSTIIFCEYLAAPLLLTASLTAAMTLVQS